MLLEYTGTFARPSHVKLFEPIRQLHVLRPALRFPTFSGYFEGMSDCINEAVAIGRESV
jgi:hypothetical protein